jgi:DNA-binding beta-propeller fold protein YncE
VVGITRGLAAAAAIGLWAGALAAPVSAAPVVPTAYVTNSQSQTVTVIRGRSAVRTISHVGKGPVGIALTPDHRTALVADYGFYGDVQSTVTPIDLTTGTPGPRIKVGKGPMAIAVTPDGKYAVVTLQGTPAVPGHQAVRITLSTGAVSPPVEVGANPESLAISPDSRMAYVAAFSAAKVTPVDLTVTPPKARPPIHLPSTSPRGIAVSPDGTKAYVTDAANATVIPISLITKTAGTPVDLVCHMYGDPGCTPSSIAITASGHAAWIAASGSDDLIELALPSLRKVKVLPTGGYPDALALARGWLYCANGASNDVSIFRATAPLATTPAGPYPIGVAIDPG